LATSLAVLLTAFALFLPAISHSRFQSQIAVCQNHLRQLGFALHDYSEHQPDASYPAVAPEGRRGVAGIYAPTLVANQLVDDSRLFGCPSSPRATQSRSGQPRAIHIPTPEELDAAEGAALQRLYETMGGDYGYNMGYTENGELIAPSDARRSEYALLADAPSDAQSGRRSLNHGAYGQNVLYEDGRVQFIRGQSWPRLLDDPFHNLNGEVAAGLGPTDHVLGASADRPLPLNK
jgi:hypothetical protein